MATIEASALGGKWSETTAWTGAKVPGEGDDVILGALSGAIETAAEAKCRSLEAGEYKSTLTVGAAGPLVIGATTSNAGLCLSLGPGMTLAGTGTIRLNSKSAEAQKLSMGGHTHKGVFEFRESAKYELLESLVAEGIIATKNTCEVITNGHAVTTSTNTVELLETSKITLGISTVTCKKWEAAAGATVTAGTSKIIASEIFAGGGHTYATVELTAAATTTVTGSNTIANLILHTAGKKVKFEKTTKTTITESITTNAKSGSKCILESSEAGKEWEISKASGVFELGYLELKDSHAVGGASWYAGLTSTNVSGNEGWKFEELKEASESLSTTQVQTVTLAKTVTRVLSITQAQAATETIESARQLLVTQAQSPSFAKTPKKGLSTTQAQAVGVAKTSARVLSLTQAQTLAGVKAPLRTLSVTQAQSVARATTAARTLGATQGQSPARSTLISRSLSMTQAQGATQIRMSIKRLAATQGQEAAVSAERATVFTAEQAQAPSSSRSPTRELGAEQPQAAGRSTEVPAILTTAQAQSAAYDPAIVRILSLGQAATPTMRRRPMRTLRCSTTQVATVVFEETPVQPYTPRWMSSSAAPVVTLKSGVAGSAREAEGIT